MAGFTAGVSKSERMSDANDNEGRPATGPRSPLSLKPRPGGSVSAGTVKQSFSHGRSKTVVVETKRRRFDTPGAAPAKPHHAPPQGFDVAKRPAPAAPAAPRPASGAADNLSTEEAARRARAVEAARLDAERRDAAAREAEASRAEEATRRKAEAAP